MIEQRISQEWRNTAKASRAAFRMACMSETADVVRMDPDGSYWVSCWNCGGAGYHEDHCVCESFEDTCMCAEPDPPACRECKGTGALGPIKP